MHAERWIYKRYVLLKVYYNEKPVKVQVKMTPYLLPLIVVMVAAMASGQHLQTNQDLDQIKFTDQSVFLECHYSGNLPANLHFTWTGPALIDLGERVRQDDDGTLSTLHIDDLSVEDAGQYVCSLGGVSSTITFSLTVKDVPHFVSEQQTRFRVPEGGDVLMPCKVGGCPDCGVLWFKNKYQDRPSGSEVEVIQDGNRQIQSFHLSNVRQEHSGLYQCVITDRSEELIFNLTVVLQDQRIPIISKTASDISKEVYYTQPLVLVCPVRSGENTTENPLTIEWVFTNIFDEPQRIVTNELRINDHYARGEYTCKATNSAGLDTLDIFVDIIAPPLPAFVSLPTVTLREGSPTAQLEFTHPTTPVARHSLHYLWEVNRGEVWVPINSDRFHVSHFGHLVITNVSLTDAGMYRVTISNNNGSSVQTQTLEVSPIPTPGPTGEAVAIGFVFELPDMFSCLELQGTSSVLTDYLMDYLGMLCANSTTLVDTACSNLNLRDVSVECEASNEKEGTFTAMLSASNARQLAQVFESERQIELIECINIVPCGGGECIDPTEVTKLKDLVLILCVIIAVLLMVIVATTICVACIIKKMGLCCKNRCKVSDIEAVIPCTPVETPRVFPDTRPHSVKSNTHTIRPHTSTDRYIERPVHPIHDTLGHVELRAGGYGECYVNQPSEISSYV